MKRVLYGGCHCGAVRVEFETAVAPAELPLRACQCAFCRAHGARTTADPQGRVRFLGPLKRYRFGLGTADFLLCPECGVYLGALCADAEGQWATLNVNCLDEGAAFAQAAHPVSYEGEDAAGRLARRKARWTPAGTGSA
jgi:hypothetical protein